ncbi:zinc ribbon domain-containing protein [Naasia lichenicola]|uniref:CT398-like coiled coil hairpin domain-containing protein n=1 Tax=Naasia lichenicola TaxID=2565933 RepID=A0A4S4FQS2_9MICO|nr:hypothetical protein [Naasia lichenicola]THG32930.1 hypothetical protein E6C64_00725 [Naasia lichenicola]
MTVTASPHLQKRLLDLQELDTRAQRLRHQEKTLPQLAELAAVGKEAEATRRQLTIERGVLEDIRTELTRIESDVSLVEARMARDTSRLAQVSSAKDAQGLEHELASLGRRRSDLEDIELAVMERVESQEGAVAELNSAAAAHAARIAALEEERDSALGLLRDELADMTGRRERIAAELPEDLLGLYERQRTRYGIGAALLTRGVSGGSQLALNASELAEIRRAAPDEVVLDPESGCILIRTEESGL